MRAFFLCASLSMLLPIVYITTAADQGSPSPSLVIQKLDSPAGAGSAEPNVYVDDGGRIYLSWIEKQGDNTHRLRFAVRICFLWSRPQPRFALFTYTAIFRAAA